MPASKTSAPPEKLYYKINEASKITGEAAYVLRYWETVFPQLRPSKDENGVRLYRKADIDLIMEIKRLRVQEGFTLEGVKKQLQGTKKPPRAQVEKQREELPEGETEPQAAAPEPAKKAEAAKKTATKKTEPKTTASLKKDLRAIRSEIESLIAEMDKAGA
ncbi:MAG: MerR family transcriptional regulator [bacterium]